MLNVRSPLRLLLAAWLLLGALAAALLIDGRSALAVGLSASPVDAQQPADPSAPELAAGAQLTSTLFLPVIHTDAHLYVPIISTLPLFVRGMPAVGQEGVSVNAYLQWEPYQAMDDAAYSILLERNDPTPDEVIVTDVRRRSYDPFTFEPGSTYYWQVLAQRADGRLERGPVWRFTTDRFDQPPDLNAMVTVPEGEFLMGCDPLHSGYYCIPGHGPLHAVWLDTFQIDKYEVTNGEYQSCVQAGVCNRPRKDGTHTGTPYYGEPAFANHPVMYVSHWDAEDYCEWEGKRLPTEAEWEKAARGAIDTRPWPWGDEQWDCTRMNRCGFGDYSEWAPAPVDSFWRNQSPYGALNLAGNVFEWVKDYNDDFYPWSPYRNPVNMEEPERGLYFSMRGGSYHDNWWYARTNHRQAGHWGDKPGGDAPLYRSFRSGFRCALWPNGGAPWDGLENNMLPVPGP